MGGKQILTTPVSSAHARALRSGDASEHPCHRARGQRAAHSPPTHTHPGWSRGGWSLRLTQQNTGWTEVWIPQRSPLPESSPAAKCGARAPPTGRMGVALPFPGLHAELPLCAAVTRGPPSTGLTGRPPATMLKLRSWFHATAYCSMPTLKPRGTARLGTSCRLGDGRGGGFAPPPRPAATSATD